MSHVTLIRKEDIAATLSIASLPGKRLLKWAIPLEENPPFHILEDVEVENEAEIHVRQADDWTCLQGEVTFVVGGELIRPKIAARDGDTPIEWKGEGIRGGEEIVLREGDILWIPQGVTHLHKKKQGFARLLIRKNPYFSQP